VSKEFTVSARDNDISLSDEATFAGLPRPPRDDVSIGDERTLGDGLSGQDTTIDDIEVIDLEARYRGEGTLGQGGMGAVMLATDTRLDRKVAIKRILGEAAGNRMAVNRFLTEAKSIAALNHPNIVQIYDYGRAKDGPFLIMEYVDGGSLLDRCRDGAMPLEQVIDMVCHVCDGLAKAHDLGIIHRDIKPANVLLTKDGIPKLTDFGLAKGTVGRPWADDDRCRARHARLHAAGTADRRKPGRSPQRPLEPGSHGLPDGDGKKPEDHPL
jgi:serine/threonine protein kinase